MNIKETMQKNTRRDFRKELLWFLYELINYTMMGAVVSAFCIYASRSLIMDNGMKFRIDFSFLVFLALYIVLVHIYDGLDVSIHRLSEIIYSQMLACLFSDTFLFLTFWLISGKFFPLFFVPTVLIIQGIFATGWSYCAIRLYFKMYKPKKTVLVYNRRSGLKKLVREYGLEKKYTVEKVFMSEEIIEQLPLLKEYETVFITDVHSSERNKILKFCIENRIQLFVIPRVGDTLMSGAKSIHMFHLPMLEVNGYHPAIYYLIFKRCFDLVVSMTGLILLSPLFLVTACAIKFTDGGPVFYKQERLTQYGKTFMIHKFRSMRTDAEKDGVARLSSGADDDRITPVGRVIRACRIDELPQLIDILKGDLSVVGPRPEREAIARIYEKEMPEFHLRLLAKAGLTGYAQVYGKYNTEPYDKLQMDLMYIAHPSIIQDLLICFATVKILFLPDSTAGVSEGQVTAMRDYSETEDGTEGESNT